MLMIKVIIGDVRCIGIGGQQEAFRLNDMPQDDYTSATKLLLSGVPVLSDSSLRLDPPRWLRGCQAPDITFLPELLLAVSISPMLASSKLPWVLALQLPLPLPFKSLSKAAGQDDNKCKAEGDGH